jgi:hypothetical protein
MVAAYDANWRAAIVWLLESCSFVEHTAEVHVQRAPLVLGILVERLHPLPLLKWLATYLARIFDDAVQICKLLRMLTE